MFCSNCGFKLADGAKFCPECGEKIGGQTLKTPLVTEQAVVAETSKDLLSEQTAVELINYIQFSVAKIVNGKSKGLLEDEFNAVINNINPTSLQNSDLISAYEELLQTLTCLKLTENEKEMLLRVLNQKKQNAIFSCLNSFGSIFVPGATPVTMLSSLLYTGVSALFNYKRAEKDAELENAEKTFDIDQSDLEYIDGLRSNLFIATAKVFVNRTNCAQGLISENEMKQFAKCANSIADDENLSSQLIVLESSEENLGMFPPYWAVLVSGYLKVENFSKALFAYEKFDALMKNNPIFKKNPYVLQAAKDKLSILLKCDNLNEKRNEILNCVELVKKNTTNITEELDNMYYYLVPIYIALNDFAGVNVCLNYLKSRELISENSRLVNQMKLLSPENYGISESAAPLEKVISSIDFGFSEHNNATLTAIMLDELRNGENIFFWAKNDFEVKPNMVFSVDGKSGMETHPIEFRSFGEYKVCILSDFTWNDLASKPFFTIVSDGFMTHFRATAEQFVDTEYFQSFETTMITNELDLLGIETDSLKQKSTLESAVSGIKEFGKSFADVDLSSARALFGGIGKRIANGAKDAAGAIKNDGEQGIDHLTVTIVAIEKNGKRFDVS